MNEQLLSILVYTEEKTTVYFCLLFSGTRDTDGNSS